MKRIVPTIDPWGTPLVTLCQGVQNSRVVTRCWRSDRKLLIILTSSTFWSHPKSGYRLFKRMQWLKVSNAYGRSKAMSLEEFENFSEMCWMTDNRMDSKAFLHPPCPLEMKPNWNWIGLLNGSGEGIEFGHVFHQSFSRTLLKDGRIEIPWWSVFPFGIGTTLVIFQYFGKTTVGNHKL